MKSSGWVLGMALAVVVAGMEPVRAQDPEDLKRGVARISFLNGEISIQRGDSGEWVAGAVNAPVVANDRISTALNSRAEIEFDSGYVVRIGGGADVTVMALEASRSQLAIGYGMLTVRVLRQTNADIEVDTPNVSVRPSKVGTYRIAVSDSGESQIIARSGDVEVFTPRGSQWVYAGQMLMARGTASDPEFQIVQPGAPDEWDRWSDSRDRPIVNSSSQHNVPPGVYGSEDLDPYGNWVNVPPYGNVWQPMEPAGWAPYQAGRWVWLDWYGWTWIGYEPWGWAPYHYGRWFYSAPYGWLWYPGAIGVRHYWSPALVAFFGFGGTGVGFANVGWVPLAPYEVLFPWWGRGYYGNAGFFRSVNVTSVNIVNTYRNARVPNAVAAISVTDFRGGRFNNYLKPQAGELGQASFARGTIPVAPDRANLRYSDRQPVSIPRSSPVKVFSYRGNPGTVAQRIPFAEQQRAFGTGPAEASRGWSRFGEAGGQQRFGELRPNSGPPSEQSARGWSRFGEPYGAARPPAGPGTAAEIPRESPGARNYPSSPSYRPSPGQSGTLRVAPPVVRERPGNGGGGVRGPGPRSAPQRSGGGGGGGRHR